jgi:hypothetical protein
VIFRFDEVVSERPAGAPNLQALFLISPRDGTPNVDWHRSEVAVRPRRGWRANTAYTITMLPGMSDLRGNIRNTGAVTLFSTGTDIPNSRVSGRVFNWLSGNLARKAFVEARTTTDTTTVFIAAADSAGSFTFPTLRAGQYRVRAILDDNNNRALDPRESWDTTSVSLTDTARVELYAFPHDSVGPRLSGVSMRDSLTLVLLFDHAVDVSQTFTAAAVTLKTADSALIPVASVSRPETTVDTTARVAARPRRPIPSTTLLVRMGVPLKQKTTVRIRVLDVRSLDGISFTSDRVETLTPPAPPPPVALPAVPGVRGAPTNPTPAPQPRPNAPPPPPPPPPPIPKSR